MKQKKCRKMKLVLMLLVFSLPCLNGCEKKDETASPTDKVTTDDISQVENTETESEFISADSVSICKLQEIKIAELDMKNPPSFTRRMDRSDKDTVKKGVIKLGDREYQLLLGENPEYEFHIQDITKDTSPYWWGSWSLHSKHLLEGQYYEFKLVANGTKIAGRPYTGEFGIFKVGSGGRKVEKMEMSGSVNQNGGVGAPIGVLTDRWPDPAPECSIPVGDYTADLLTVVYDDLRIEISNNYYTNAQGEKTSNNNRVYGMQVCKDKPYVLDFSNKPMIVFETPKIDGQTYSVGDEIKFSAVLIDPKLDIMIRGLNDTSEEVEKEYKDKDGNVVHTAKIPKSLDPEVVVTRSDGEIAGQGTMPFG